MPGTQSVDLYNDVSSTSCEAAKQRSVTSKIMSPRVLQLEQSIMADAPGTKAKFQLSNGPCSCHGAAAVLLSESSLCIRQNQTARQRSEALHLPGALSRLPMRRAKSPTALKYVLPPQNCKLN